jgi:hypothetical protein
MLLADSATSILISLLLISNNFIDFCYAFLLDQCKNALAILAETKKICRWILSISFKTSKKIYSD